MFLQNFSEIKKIPIVCGQYDLCTRLTRDRSKVVFCNGEEKKVKTGKAFESLTQGETQNVWVRKNTNAIIETQINKAVEKNGVLNLRLVSNEQKNCVQNGKYLRAEASTDKNGKHISGVVLEMRLNGNSVTQTMVDNFCAYCVGNELPEGYLIQPADNTDSLYLLAPLADYLDITKEEERKFALSVMIGLARAFALFFVDYKITIVEPNLATSVPLVTVLRKENNVLVAKKSICFNSETASPCVYNYGEVFNAIGCIDEKLFPSPEELDKETMLCCAEVDSVYKIFSDFSSLLRSEEKTPADIGYFPDSACNIMTAIKLKAYLRSLDGKEFNNKSGFINAILLALETGEFYARQNRTRDEEAKERKKIKAEKAEEIVKDYVNGMKIADIRNKFKCTIYFIYRALKKNHCEQRNAKSRHQLKKEKRNRLLKIKKMQKELISVAKAIRQDKARHGRYIKMENIAPVLDASDDTTTAIIIAPVIPIFQNIRSCELTSSCPF